MCIKYCRNLNNKEDFKHIFNTYYMFNVLLYVCVFSILYVY